MNSTGKKRAELKRLSAAVQSNIFEMLKLANEILQDGEYVDSFGGEAQARDDMEAKEFSHFGGNPSLGAMLQAFRKNPDLKTWKEYRFNIRAMIDLANPREQSDTVRVNWKSQAKLLEAELGNAKTQLAEQSKTISELRAKLDELNGLLGEYRGRVQELEKFSPRRELAGAR